MCNRLSGNAMIQVWGTVFMNVTAVFLEYIFSGQGTRMFCDYFIFSWGSCFINDLWLDCAMCRVFTSCWSLASGSVFGKAKRFCYILLIKLSVDVIILSTLAFKIKIKLTWMCLWQNPFTGLHSLHIKVTVARELVQFLTVFILKSMLLSLAHIRALILQMLVKWPKVPCKQSFSSLTGLMRYCSTNSLQ